MSRFEKEKFEPVEQTDIKLMKQSKQLPNIPNNIGIVQYSSLFTSKANISKKHLPLVGKESTCTLSLSSSNGSPVPVPSSLISCSLSTPDSKLSIECSVKESRQTGEYTVTFTPITRGLHQLQVRIGKSHVRGSPVSIPVSVPPEDRHTPVDVITGLSRPWGVAMTKEGLMVVSEYDRNCVTILNKEGKKIKSLGLRGTGRGHFKHPTGIAQTATHAFLVADCDNHHIQQFTMDGECLLCVGSKGIGPLQFNEPTGIAVSKVTGQVFVSELGNHRIQVLNSDSSFSRTFGVHGSKEGQFNEPRDLTVDDTGALFVADTFNHRIQQFTSEGRFVSLFKTNTDFPVGIVSCDGVLYVIQHGNKGSLSMYTTSGSHLVSVGGKDSATLQLKTPQHVTIDSEGYLYVSDFNNYRVLIL